MPPPELKHDFSMLATRRVPARRIAVEPIRQFLPHESRVAARRRLARIEQCRAGAPHHGWRDRPRLVMTHDVEKLIDVIESHDHHEGLRKLRTIGCSGVTRWLGEIEMECE